MIERHLSTMRRRAPWGDHQRPHAAWWCVALCVVVMVFQFYGCQRHLWEVPTTNAEHNVGPTAPANPARSTRRTFHVKLALARGVREHAPIEASRNSTAVETDGAGHSLEFVGTHKAPAKTAEKIILSAYHRSLGTNSSKSARSGLAHITSRVNTSLAAPVLVLADAPNSQGPKQVCAGYLLGIGTTKGGTTSLWAYIHGWGLDQPFHPHLLVPSNIVLKESYWWMHSNPSSTLWDFEANLQNSVQPAPEVRLDWQRLSAQPAPDHLLCPAPEAKEMRVPARVFQWSNDVNGTAVDWSKLKPLYKADITPEYMYDPRVPARVKSLLPEARMVVLLRNPVSRTISEWAMNWNQPECQIRASVVSTSPTAVELRQAWQEMLHTQVTEGMKTYQGCYQATLAKSAGLQQEFLACLGYDNPYTPRFMQNALPTKCGSGIGIVGHSVYVDQLERWFELFPASQFKIWISEDFSQDPGAHMLQLVPWLNLDPTLTSPTFKSGKQLATKLHTGRYEAQADMKTQQMLHDFYAPHNERLFSLLEAKGFGDIVPRMRELWNQQTATI